MTRGAKLPAFDAASWRYYASLYRTRGVRLSLAVGTSVLQSFLVVPMAYLVRFAFNSITGSHDRYTLLLAGGALVGLQCAIAALALAGRWISLEETKRVIRDLRSRLLARAYLVSSPFAATADRAWLHTAIVHDTESVDVMSNALLVVLLPNAVTAALLIPILVVFDPWLTLAVAGLAPLAWMLNRWIGRKLKGQVVMFRSSFEHFSQGILFALRQMELTRTRGAQDWEQARQRERAEELRQISGRMAWLASAYSVAQGTTGSFGAIITLVVGGGAVAAGRMSMGTLVAFYFVLATLNGVLRPLWSSIPQVITGGESLRRIHQLVSREARTQPGGKRKVELAEGISLEGVGFGYGSSRLFSNLSLRVERGKMTAVLGRNGAGKTTLAYLMMGLYEPQQGRMSADGAPFSELDLESLRRQIGFVMEEPWIFSGTIQENIAYGRPDAADSAIAEACAASTSDEFIARLPDGLQTVIGDGGVSLSAGQYQRIAVARALLSRPRLLILDEPTSHMDALTIGRLFANLRAMPWRPGIFLITHDSALGARADQCYELRDGVLLPVVAGVAATEAKSSKGLRA